MMSPLRLLPALVLALLVLSSCCSSSAARSDIAGEQVSFGSGYSQYTLTSAETAFFNHTVADSGSYGVLTHFWITGGASALIDTSVWSYYIDGESSPSIQFTPAMAAGVGFADPTAPWGNRWMGKGAADGGWYNNLSASQPRSDSGPASPPLCPPLPHPLSVRAVLALQSRALPEVDPHHGSRGHRRSVCRAVRDLQGH